MRTVDNDLPWRERAACIGFDPRIFIYPPDTPVGRRPKNPKDKPRNSADIARAICEDCPVKEPCHQEGLTPAPGLDTQVRPGIWGGENQKDRQKRMIASGTIGKQ